MATMQESVGQNGWSRIGPKPTESSELIIEAEEMEERTSEETKVAGNGRMNKVRDRSSTHAR